MEKKKSKSYLIFILIIICIFSISIYKVYQNHKEKSYLVVNSKIKEAAINCYLEEKCDGKIKLKDLIEKGYIEKIIDPVTKEYISEDLCISFEDTDVVFCD